MASMTLNAKPQSQVVSTGSCCLSLRPLSLAFSGSIILSPSRQMSKRDFPADVMHVIADTLWGSRGILLLTGFTGRMSDF